MSSEPALLSIDGPIATITLNRPEAFNSVNLAIAQKLEQLGAEVEANDGIKVLVIQGEGRAFSAGGIQLGRSVDRQEAGTACRRGRGQ